MNNAFMIKFSAPFSALCFVLVGLAGVRSVQALDLPGTVVVEDAPAPEAPFFKQPADPYRLQINIKQPKLPSGSESKAESVTSPEGASPVRITISQAGRVRSEEFILASGYKREKWFIDNTLLYIPHGQQRVMMNRAARTDPLQDIRWISSDNYVHTVSLKGRLLQIFTETKSWGEVFVGGKADPAAFGGELPPDVTRTVVVDAATKYPLMLEIDKSLYTYTILPPPDALRLPGPYAAAARRLEGR